MSGGITYNGVPVKNGGRIFDGLKFWVSQRVPQRTTLLDHIQSNSGVVVPLEKDADYLIADHARKDATSGSISWKFITESVDNGVVQLPDRYKIAHAPAGPRQSASGRPAKRTRTDFTDAEDATLASWVLAHDTNRTGNEIYMRFEAMHPRHTWQSWRNRYVKKLMLIPHASLLKLACKAVDEPSPQAIDGDQPTQELPDPTDLMLQRKGERVQRETALQRAKGRAIQPSAIATQASTPPPPQVTEQDDTATTEAKNQFYDDLQVFCEESRVEITHTQQVAGQPVELWELSKTVSEQRLPAEEIDWLRVAEELGYTWLDMDAAVQALQRCYEKNLAEFLDVMGHALEGDEDAEAPESTVANSPEAATGNSPASSRGQLPLSPPARFLPAKRPTDADGELDIPSPKRRRLHIPPEIPSTPEAGRRRSTPRTSKRLAGKTAPVQFETQIPSLNTQESSIDMTPSQQLQSEHVNNSPIPLRLNSAAQNRHLGAASKQSNTNVKLRILPEAWKRSALIEEEGGQGSLFFSDDEPNALFPRALPSAQPPAPPVGPPAQAAPRRLSKEQELSDLIQHYESLGYANKTVIEGLKRTTMTPGLATVVMQSLQEGKGVPTHHEGIWTDRDDVGLRLAMSIEEWGTSDRSNKDAVKVLRKAQRARDRLRDKHGQERMALRIKFLRAKDRIAAAANEQLS